MFCMRHDTRNGEIKRVKLDHIPVSQGKTRSSVSEAGTYQLECAATSSEKKADVYCVRLNTESGDMLLVALPKVGEIPE